MIPSPQGQEKPLVEEALNQAFASGQSNGYLIYFREKADLSAAENMDWASRGWFVMQALQTAADKAQAQVRAYLDAQGVKYQAFWIDNLISVESSDLNTFSTLQNFPEIESFKAHRKLGIIEPEKTPVSMETPDLPLAVEPNITHVGANQAWSLGINGQGIVVASIDTGVRYTHQALVSHYRGNLGGSYNHNYNWWDPYLEYSSPTDVNGHGSHTMGTMIGDDGGANQIGMAPGAEWMACLGCSSSGCTDAALLECAQFLAAPWDLTKSNPDPGKRPQVINNSWGDCSQSYDSWYQNVVDSWQAAGIYPVFSNGNASNCSYSSPPGLNTVGNPARYGNVTGVGSSGTNNGQYASHSNWGPTDNLDTLNPRGFPNLKPQVIAPGVNIRSSVPTSDTSYESGWSGTSMSAPHVTGLVALVWQAAPCLVGDYAATETLIEQTAIPVPYDSGGTPPPGTGNVPNYAAGWGEINALAAVQAGMNSCGDSILQGAVTSGAQPVAGATVMVQMDATLRTTLTGPDGAYSFSLSGGAYTATIQAFGYQTLVVPDIQVLSGETTNFDFTLVPANSYQVSGVVQDAHTGWPLYARLHVDGIPVEDIWTNPVDGSYSLFLPEGQAYAFHATAWVSGYLEGTATVGPLTGPVIQNYSLAFDPVSCSAPGYGRTYFSESFDSIAGFPAGGWDQIDISADGNWATSTATVHPGGISPHSGARLAYFNSFTSASGSATRLFRTTGADLTNATTPTAKLWVYHESQYAGSTDQIQVQVSVDGGSTWQNAGAPIVRPNGTTGWQLHSIDISAYTGQSDVRLALLGTSWWGNDIHVDDLSILDCGIPTGGLVAGNVADANTTLPLPGSIVTNTYGESTIAMATLDPNVGDAFFTIYAPTGASTFTASLPGSSYGSTSVSLAINGGSTTGNDFSLPAGFLSAGPNLVAAQVPLGHSVSIMVTMGNQGGLQATYELKEKPVSPSAQAESLPAGITPEMFTPDGSGGAYTDSSQNEEKTALVIPPKTTSPSTPDDSWEAKAPLPSGRVFHATVADNAGFVYVIAGSNDAAGLVKTNTTYRYNTAADTWEPRAPAPVTLSAIDGAFIEGKIYIPGDDATGDTYIYDTTTNTWATFPANGGYSGRMHYKTVAVNEKLYVLGGTLSSSNASTNEVWILNTSTGLWSPGIPMQKSRINFSAAAIEGQIYVAGGVAFPGFAPDMTAEKFDGSVWSYIASVPDGAGSYTRWSYNADGQGSTGLWLAAGRRDTSWAVLNHAGYYDPATDSWTTTPDIPALTQGRVYMSGDVASDGYFYVIGGRDSAGTVLYTQNERLQVGYVPPYVDVPWLSESPITGTIPAASNQTIQIDLTAVSTMTLGTYQAEIQVKNDTPYGTFAIPVTMHVILTEYGASLSPDQTRSGAGGETVDYTVTLTNTGKLVDTYNLTTGTSNWSVIPSQTHFGPLQPGEAAAFHVLVTVPDGALGSETDSVILTLTSVNDASKSDQAILTTTAEAAYGVALASLVPALSALPGDTVTYTLQLANLGNTTDIINLALSGVLPGWQVQLSGTQISLQAGATTPIQVRVTVPANALAGAQDPVVITAVSQGDGTKTSNVAVTTSAATLYDCLLVPAVDTKNGKTGTQVPYSILITNTGNSTDKFTANLTSSRWTVNLPQPVTLNPGQSGEITLWVTVPQGAAIGSSDQATITITSLGAHMHAHQLKITTVADPWSLLLPVVIR